jgi:hypothetical protein
MIHDKKTSRVWLTASLLGASLLVSGLAITAVAQDAQTQEKATTSSKKATSGGRDPFKKYEPPRVSTKLAGQANVPSIQDRINRYKAQKAAAMSARMTAPKPTTALLLSEIQVIGISRTPRGYAAIIEATPIKLSYVVYPGELFYDGQLVAIEDSRLVFRRETVFTDGRRERSVEYKPLRQPSPVNAMPVPGAANTSQSVASANPQ